MKTRGLLPRSSSCLLIAPSLSSRWGCRAGMTVTAHHNTVKHAARQRFLKSPGRCNAATLLHTAWVDMHGTARHATPVLSCDAGNSQCLRRSIRLSAVLSVLRSSTNCSKVTPRPSAEVPAVSCVVLPPPLLAAPAAAAAPAARARMAVRYWPRTALVGTRRMLGSWPVCANSRWQRAAVMQ